MRFDVCFSSDYHSNRNTQEKKRSDLDEITAQKKTTFLFKQQFRIVSVFEEKFSLDNQRQTIATNELYDKNQLELKSNQRVRRESSMIRVALEALDVDVDREHRQYILRFRRYYRTNNEMKST